MRKTAPILLALLFLLHSAGYFLIFKVRQLQIRSEVSTQQVSHDQVTFIRFSVARSDTTRQGQLIWKDRREFRFNGCMYDIAMRKEYKDSMHYYCYADEKETHLYAFFDQLFARTQNSDTPKDQNEQLIKLVFAQYTAPDGSYHFGLKTSKCPSIHYGFSLQTWIMAPCSPPPDKRFIS